MKNAVRDIIGKRISGVIAKERKPGDSPRSQVFLLFDDDTYYEFYTGYTDTIVGAGGVDAGGRTEVLEYASGAKVVADYGKR